MLVRKAQTERVATAQAKVYLRPETLEKIQRSKIAKGDVWPSPGGGCDGQEDP
jgi:molybdenum cofactor biosynthesis enzyme